MISFQTYNIAANPRISVAEAKSTHGWNIVFRRNLNDWELQSVAELWETLEAFQGLTEEEDVLMWKSHKSGAFSVKIAYHFINTIANPTQGWPWKQIWRVRVPKKVLCFTWLVAREAVLTQDNLIRRGIQLQARCSLCGKDGESASHLFIHCPVTTQLWHFYLNLAGISWTMPNNTTSLLSSWNNGGANIKQKKWWKVVLACIWWVIWKERNARVFENRPSSYQKIKLNCFLLFHFWCKESYREDVHSLLDLPEKM